MKTKLLIILIISPLLSSTLSAQVASGGAFTLERSVVATGGNESAGGAFLVTGTSGQNAAGTNTTNFPFNQIGGFWTPDQLQPTAALVSIGGRITTAGGNSISNVFVTLSDMNGSTRITATGSFGRYTFTDVEVGQTYVLSVKAGRHIFVSSSQIISVFEELRGVDFIAEEQF